MVAAVGLQNESTVEQQALPPSRGEVLARYRLLRDSGKRHHSEAMIPFRAPPACRQQAFEPDRRRFGLMLSHRDLWCAPRLKPIQILAVLPAPVLIPQ
jgi:hypothetical protein